MAKSSSNSSGPLSLPLFPDLPLAFLSLSQLRVNGGLPISPFLEFARSQARIASRCGSEIARFAEQRLDRDEQRLSAMASCKDWSGVAELQVAWAAEVLEDYMQETGQLMELLRGACSEAVGASKKTGWARKSTRAAAA